MSNFLDSGPRFTGLVSPNAWGIDLDQLAFWFRISWLVPGDIRDQSRKLCKMSPNFVFLAPNFFRGQPPNFRTWIIKLTHILITCQSFMAIGWGSSEILWRI